ncbi:progonadoliberin-1-like [Boleophthalmus pectinirostris]|uniref:progonadoliberin-1-like n=1 Tax=Boleophthalmus pectinirostris TaxID=150288 RepID=UPI000A1C3BDF|nr:progonadoliberin-1-like [Boleophthalmus pectinirostris]
MAYKSSALLLWVFGLITSQVWSQHWSFGLSPGGKRELDGLSQTLSNIVERFQHVDTPCSVVGCREEMPKIYRLKRFLGNVADSGHQAFEK